MNAEAQEAEANVPELRVGLEVTLRGLKKMELIGKWGKIVRGPDEGGRWGVVVTGFNDGKPVAIKTANMVPRHSVEGQRPNGPAATQCARSGGGAAGAGGAGACRCPPRWWVEWEGAYHARVHSIPH